MKLSKTEFKGLMKEVLTELINEGAFDKKLGQIAEAKIRTTGGFQHNNPIIKETATHDAAVNARLKEVVSSITNAQPNSRKNLFQEILMDTAMTTLQKQLTVDGGYGSQQMSISMPISEGEKAIDDSQLQILSSGNVNRWATAAFAGQKKKP